MDIMALGAIGELVGGVAVIASLIYVGRQVRQSADQTQQRNAIERAQAGREITRAYDSFALAFSGAEEMRMLRTGMSDFDSLDPNDQARLHLLLSMRVSHAASIQLAAKEGLVDEGFARAWVRALAAWVATPGLQSWWDRARQVYHEDIVADIEALLTGSPPISPATDSQTWFGPDAVRPGNA